MSMAPHDLPRNDTFAALWSALQPNQRLFVLARLEGMSITDAAEKVGVNRSTASRWRDADRAIELVQTAALDSAMSILQQSLVEAAVVKVTGLRSGDERVAQAAANDVLDRFAGKAKTPVDLTHAGAVEHVQVYLPNNGREQA